MDDSARFIGAARVSLRWQALSRPVCIPIGPLRRRLRRLWYEFSWRLNGRSDSTASVIRRSGRALSVGSCWLPSSERLKEVRNPTSGQVCRPVSPRRIAMRHIAVADLRAFPTQERRFTTNKSSGGPTRSSSRAGARRWAGPNGSGCAECCGGPGPASHDTPSPKGRSDIMRFLGPYR